MTPRIVCLESDLLFGSKIEAISKKHAAEVKFVTDLRELESVIAQLNPQIVIVNLDSIGDEFSNLQTLSSNHDFRAVGYYSHTDADLGMAARKAGFDVVLSRGAFLGRFDGILANVNV